MVTFRIAVVIILVVLMLLVVLGGYGREPDSEITGQESAVRNYFVGDYR